jgi:hypothetical protein
VVAVFAGPLTYRASMRSFSEFNAAPSHQAVEHARLARLRTSATWAYLLYRPGMEFVRQRSNFILGWQAGAAAPVADGANAGAVGTSGVPPLGSWMNLPDMASPATRTVLPSTDAIYGAAHLELDLIGPMLVRVPAKDDDLYFSVAVMDAHMNNLGHIGPAWDGRDGIDCLIVPPEWSAPVPDGIRVIASSTPSVCLYNRVLVGFDDHALDRARQWRARIQLVPWNKRHEPSPIPAPVDVEAFVHPALNTETDAAAYLRIGAGHVAHNPLHEGAQWLVAVAAEAAEAAVAPTPDERSALEAGVGDATAIIDAVLGTWPRGNGWMLPDARLGLPNALVAVSAAFQQFQIGSNDISESAYWFSDTDGAGEPLDASNGRVYSWTLTAADVPPLRPGGYWSITMYDANSFLVDNPEHRYATRPQRPGTVVDPDGSLTLMFSVSRPAAVPQANWLPAPDGKFRLGVRVYYPDQAIINGSWVPPAALDSA